MRTLHADLTAAQVSTSATPYLEIKFEQGRGGTSYTYKTTDSPNKIKALRHTEEPYNSTAILVLDNYDRALPDLFGYYCTIGYGYNTASGDKKSDAAPLWVKRQFHTSKMGSLDNIIYMEGAWNVLSEMRDIASLLGATPPPYYEIDYTATSFTIYDIVKQVLNVAGFGLYALGGEDDSIVDTLQPDFVVNSAAQFENAATIIYRLMNMTKVFCRTEVPTSTVGTSGPHTVATGITIAGATGLSYQRISFWACGLYWQFYSDGTNLVYETSSDGETWTGSVTTIGAANSGGDFSVWYDTTSGKFCYSRADGDFVYFRMGECAIDGTITYDAAEQTVYDSSGGGSPLRVVVILDSNGYPWIIYVRGTTYIDKSNATDGTWTSDTNFPYDLTGVTYATVVPLKSGRVYAVYLPASGTSTGKLWGGSSWGSAEEITTDSIYYPAMVSVEDDVHYAWVDRSTNTVKYRKRTYGTGWETVETVSTSGVWSNSRAIITIVDNTANIVVLWSADEVGPNRSAKVKYSIRSGGSWSTAADLCSDNEIRDSSITVAARIYSDQIIVAFSEGNSGEPYDVDVKVAKLEPPLNVSFRIKYPSGYGSYDYTYLSDKPASTDHQFREFEWRDQNKIPNIVYVLANQSADGNWDSIIVGGGEQYAKAGNNNYPDIVEYYVASTLANQTDADNRAAAIALRSWMEAELARVVVPHNCGQEIYDWIKIRDKRGTTSYADYPPSRWGNGAIVGALTHVYDPARGVYDLEITINGIESSAPVDATVPITSMEEEIGITQEAMEGMKETVRVWSEQTGQNVAENLEAFAKGIEELRHRVDIGTLMPERATVTYQEWAKKFGYAPALFQKKEDWAESRRVMKKYYDWAWGVE